MMNVQYLGYCIYQLYTNMKYWTTIKFVSVTALALGYITTVVTS